MFVTGNRVRLLRTKEEGYVTEVIKNGMIHVILDSGYEIPVFKEDLEMIRRDGQSQPSKPLQEQPSPDKLAAIKVEKDDLTGVFLSFEPLFRNDGTTYVFQASLINKTSTPLIFSCTCSVKGVVGVKINNTIASSSSLQIDKMIYDDLNESPVYDFDCTHPFTDGSRIRVQKTIKIKAKQFFKKSGSYPTISKIAHVYELYNNSVFKEKKDLSLTEYTKNSLEEQEEKSVLVDIHNLKAFRDFSLELDLHIENLPGDAGKLSNSEKLKLQLITFEKYLATATRLNVPRVFIIHGVGKGRLKNEIASRLIGHPDIASFKNEFHPKYGFGATEIIF